MSIEQYDGCCEIIWPAKSSVTCEFPGPLFPRGMKIFDAISGEQLVTILGIEICIGGPDGWTPTEPVTAKITAFADAEGRILSARKPIVYENLFRDSPIAKTMDFLYLVTAMRVE